jgi:hypothetical protein
MAILDIDLTLVENADRNRAIWRDWMRTLVGRWPEAEQRAVEAETMPIVFGVHENMATLGVGDSNLQEEGLRFWLKAFFCDEYARLDEPLEGATEAVRRLLEAGVTVAYVTARPEKMVPVTVECLARMGFPVGVAGTILATRPQAATSDEEAKGEAYGWLGSMGTPILNADNEPGHVNATCVRFPEAMNVLVDTRHSPGAPELSPHARRVPRLLDAVLS